MKKRKLMEILIILLIMNGFSLVIKAYTDTYPYSGAIHCGCEVDPWSFFKRQCTSYVAWKLNEAGINFSNGMIGPNNNPGWFGNAENWDNNAGNIGYVVNNTPEVGSVAVWEANSGGAGSVGHVAWVEEVNGDNSVNISEYNWNWGDGSFNSRTNKVADKYIHFNINSCGSSNVVLQNKTVQNGSTFNCGASNSITVQPESQFFEGSSVRLYIN